MTDKPLEQQLTDLFDQLKKAVDTEKHPEFKQYVENSQNYLSNVFKEMSESTDKDATSEKIANDLTGKLNTWLDKKKAELDAQKLDSSSQSDQKPLQSGDKPE